MLVLTLQQRTSGDATRVFNPYTPSHRGTTLAQRYRRNEQEKKRVYEEKVREVEYGSFSPLIFSTSVGMGPIATVVYKWIATLIAEKRDQPYSRTLFWICYKLSLVSTVCTCANDSGNLLRTSPIMDMLHVVVMWRNNQTRHMACSVAAVLYAVQ